MDKKLETPYNAMQFRAMGDLIEMILRKTLKKMVCL